jgi:hypothetical protein
MEWMASSDCVEERLDCWRWGAVDHDRHQRQRKVQGSSHGRTRRRVTGQVVVEARAACESASIFLPAGRRAGRIDRVHASRSLGLGRWFQASGGSALLGEPGLPAEREGTADQVPVATDRTIAAHHEVRPAQFLLHLLVALLDPVAQSVQAHDLRQPGRGMRRVGRSK